MGRLSNSWDLLKSSLRVVRQDKELMVLPILSFLATVATLLAILGAFSPFWPEIMASGQEGGDVDPMALVFALSLYIGLAFVTVFFQAALIHGVHERLGGGDPTVGSALRGAGKHVGKIFIYAIISGIVSLLLQILRERVRGGQFLAFLGGTAWSLITWLIVPVLLFENEGVGGSVKRSGQLFKKTWGESLVGEYGLGMLFGLLLIPILILTFALTFGLWSVFGMAGMIAGIAIGVLLAVFLHMFQYVLTGAYKAALYRFVTKGEVAQGFDQAMFTQAFHHR